MTYHLSSKLLITLGRNIKMVRKEQKRNQEDVAFEAGIEPSYFARIERGEANPSLDKIYAITKALKVNSSVILPF